MFKYGPSSTPASGQPASMAPSQEYTLVSSSSPAPSLSQLASLSALPAALVRPVLRRQKGGGKSRRKSDHVAKFFNSVAGRPYPTVTRLQQMIRVTDEYAGTLLQTSTTVPVYSALYFQLSSFGRASNYLTVFDQYHIERLEIWIENVSAQGATSFDLLATAIDLDDANTPTSIAEVESKQGALIGNGGAGRYFSWAPHMATAAYSGAFTSYANVPAGWIDSASPNVQHFGLKAFASPTGISQYVSYRVRATIGFRAPGI